MKDHAGSVARDANIRLKPARPGRRNEPAQGVDLAQTQTQQ